MAEKSKLQMQIEASEKRLEKEQNRLKLLEKKQTEKDRKDRNHRLCKRHAHLESLLPVTIEITDEQFYSFIEQHIANKHGIAALATLSGQTAETIAAAFAEAKGKAKKSASAPTVAGQSDNSNAKNATQSSVASANTRGATA